MELNSLCELFAIAPSTLSRVLNNAEVALNQSLKLMKRARISFPSKRRQMKWAELTNVKESLLKGVFGFADGKNLRVQKPTHIELQNSLYNGLIANSNPILRLITASLQDGYTHILLQELFS
jgi:hypothetical protein